MVTDKNEAEISARAKGENIIIDAKGDSILLLSIVAAVTSAICDKIDLDPIDAGNMIATAIIKNNAVEAMIEGSEYEQ